MNNRRRLVIALGAGALAAPLASFAQKPPARIAWLGAGTPSGSAFAIDAFKEGLRDNGLIEGKNYVLDALWAEGKYERFPAFVKELLERKPDVIMASTIAAAQAAQQATKTIPIVIMSFNDPVGVGLIASLARPGGNTTGTANLSEDLTPKLMEFLRAAVPQAKQVAVLLNPGNPAHAKMLTSARAAADAMGIALQPVEVKTPDGLDAAFAALGRQRLAAVLILPDFMLMDSRDRVSALALKYRLPTIASQPEYADAGAMMSYGAPRRAIYRHTAIYVKKILNGARPADLPVEQPTRIELWVNVRTAKALGIKIPQSILVRADKVIE